MMFYNTRNVYKLHFISSFAGVKAIWNSEEAPSEKPDV